MQSNQPEESDRPDPMRRRLAKGGLAGSVVLGSLISKPVLAGPKLSPPYHCTVSGQISGNMSPRDDSTMACTTLGRSPTQWKDAPEWPGGIPRGILPEPYPAANTDPAPYPFSSRSETTFFNGFQGLPTSFRYNNNGIVKFNTSLATRPASILQILSSDNMDLDFQFGRETIAAVFNSLWVRPGSDYPLSTEEVVAMYLAVYRGGSFQVNTSTPWNRSQVMTYFRSIRSA